MPGLTGHLRLLSLLQLFPPAVANHDGRRQLRLRLLNGAAALGLALLHGRRCTVHSVVGHEVLVVEEFSLIPIPQILLSLCCYEEDSEG